MPGGGSVTMTNYIYRSAPEDGTVLGYSLPGIITAQLIEPRRAKYDGRKLQWIGSALKYTGIVSVLSTAPATTIEQAKHTEVFIGTTGRGSPAHQFPAMAQAILGLKFNIITGYESSNDVALAMERGEIHGQSSSLQYWAISRPEWLTDERIVHLLYVGPPDPLARPGVPYLAELTASDTEEALVEFIEIGSRLGWPLFAPPGAPRHRVTALREAFADLMGDREFIEYFQSTVRGQLDPSIGDDLAALVERALRTPESTLVQAKTILGLER
jgi:tripartite-type tricarboxylate transporter receptor subunit TctC